MNIYKTWVDLPKTKNKASVEKKIFINRTPLLKFSSKVIMKWLKI